MWEPEQPPSLPTQGNHCRCASLALPLREGCLRAPSVPLAWASSPGKLCPPPGQGPNATLSSLFPTPTQTA